jgi:hypothetical protein
MIVVRSDKHPLTKKRASKFFGAVALGSARSIPKLAERMPGISHYAPPAAEI